MDRWERLETSDGDAVRKWWAATPERRAAFTRAAQERGDRRFDELTREQWADWARVGVLPPDVRPGHALPVPPAGLADVWRDVVAEILGGWRWCENDAEHICTTPPVGHANIREAHPIETADGAPPVRWAYRQAPAHPVSGDLDRSAGRSGGSTREIRHGAILWRAVRPVTLAEADDCRADVNAGLLPDLALWERVEPVGVPAERDGWTGWGTVTASGSSAGKAWVEVHVAAFGYPVRIPLAEARSFRPGARFAVAYDQRRGWSLLAGVSSIEPAGKPPADVGGWPDRHVVGSYGDTRPAERVDSEGWPGLGNGWLTYDAYDRWLRHLHSAKLARQWVNALCAVVAVMCAVLQAFVPIDTVDLTAIVGSTSFLFAVYPAVKMFDAYANARAVRGQNYVGPVR